MKKITVWLILVFSTIAASVALFAANHGTPAEAKAMLDIAVAHYKSVGRKQALADFNAKKPPFWDRDLYVVCVHSDHVLVASGAFPQYVGTSVDVFKDADGKSLGKVIWDVALTKAEGSVKYRMLNPVTHQVEPKITFFQKIGDDACGVGAYNP